jgi:hypothetical protein
MHARSRHDPWATRKGGERIPDALKWGSVSYGKNPDKSNPPSLLGVSVGLLRNLNKEDQGPHWGRRDNDDDDDVDDDTSISLCVFMRL